MTGKKHVHTMKPFVNPDGKIPYQRCTSCAFKCTNGALRRVEAQPEKHVAVRRNSKQAAVIWGAENG